MMPVGLAVVGAVLLSGANVVLGDLNQDEGWYLYAAKMVSQGYVPYRDFAFTQGPMLPSMYALVYPVVTQWGVLGGRVITAVLGLLACGCAAGLAGRMAPPRWKAVAGWSVFMLLGLNVYHSYFTAIVKTYSLCSVFLVCGLLALSVAEKSARREWLFGLLSGFLMAGAAGTRLSAGAAMAVTGFYLLFRFGFRHWRAWVAYGLGGVSGLTVIYARYLWLAPAGMRFGLLEYHGLRSAGSLWQMLMFKAGFLSRMVQGYYLIAVLCVVCALLYMVGRRVKEGEGQSPCGLMLLWLIGVVLTVVHASAPFPYDDYQVVVMPVLAMACVVGLVRWLAARFACTVVWRNSVLAVVFAACAAGAVSSPINQDWMVLGRDRIWWVMKQQPDIMLLRKVGQILREQAKPGDRLLTQDTYLAVEANMNVPRGLEMGPFSYYPGFSDERAEAVGGVLNAGSMRRLLAETDAPWAAFSGYGLSIRSPEVERLEMDERMELEQALHKNYTLITTVPDFGQGHTRLRIYRRKD
jgi:hypothetical protein